MAFLCAFTASPLRAQEVKLPDKIIAAGSGQEYWISLTGKQADQRVSSIRQRIDPVRGRWIEVARFQSEITSIAIVGNRLAVLLPTGEWRLLSSGPGPLGTPLPDGYRPFRFAGDGESLLAIATGQQASPTTSDDSSPSTSPAQPPKASVLSWDGQNWEVVTTLPTTLETGDVEIARAHGTLFSAGRHGDAIEVWAYRGDAWQKISTRPGNEITQFKLLTGKTHAMIATQSPMGNWSLHTAGSDQSPRVFETPVSSDLAMVGSTLRVIYLKDNRIEQLAYDDYGAGEAYPISTIGDLGLPNQAVQTWWHLIGLILLTLTMVLTFRQRPATPNESLERAKVRVAPLGRRIAAGVIDAVPQFIGMGYMLKHAQTLQPGIGLATAEVFVPYLIGLAVYLLHVTVSEAIWGRSFGKFLFGLRVLNYDGTRVSPERIILRNLLRLVDLLFYAPLLLVLLTPMGQRVGDLAARTIVVYENDESDKPADSDD